MLNQHLIPIFTGELAGHSTQLVNARELYIFLESRQRFADWIKNRIRDFDFEENVDYRLHKIMTEYNQLDRIEYYLTLDMAKELAMVERNAKGKQARHYFIECEKRFLSGFLEFLQPITEPITLEDFKWRKQVVAQVIQHLEQAQVIVSGKELLATQ